jgi:transposase-like protein
MADYTYNGRKPDIRKKIIRMSLSGSGIRDIARVLEISTDTVISELKKKKAFSKRLITIFWIPYKILKILK